MQILPPPLGIEKYIPSYFRETLFMFLLGSLKKKR